MRGLPACLASSLVSQAVLVPLLGGQLDAVGAEGVLEHLLKSGAGTAFHDAVDPARRDGLQAEFLRRLADRHPSAADYEVSHEFIACVATKS